MAFTRKLSNWMMTGCRYFAQVPVTRRTNGEIQLILGPMFSGKTTELMRRVQRYDIAKLRCLMIKYSHDTRYNNQLLATHDGLTHSAVSTLKLMDLQSMAQKHDVIGIDEGQFYPDLAEFCEDLATAHHKTVVVAALDGTFQRKMFAQVADLVPMCESVFKLEAVCSNCGQDAPFSRRLTAETEVEVIGGTEKYMAACRQCYHLPAEEIKASHMV